MSEYVKGMHHRGLEPEAWFFRDWSGLPPDHAYLVYAGDETVQRKPYVALAGAAIGKIVSSPQSGSLRSVRYTFLDMVAHVRRLGHS